MSAYNVILDNGLKGEVDSIIYSTIYSTIFDFIMIGMMGYIYIFVYRYMDKYFFDNSDKQKYKSNTNIYKPEYKYLQDYMDELKLDEMPYDLGKRMKIYEDYTEYYVSHIDASTGFIVRVDGRCFSNLLHTLKNKEFEELKTPFISDFVLAMQRTTRDIVKEFNASTGYTHSDEISLYFKPLNKEEDPEEDIKEHQFSGRVQKLQTLIASYATVRLIKHLTEINKDKFYNILDKVSFDGRVLIFPFGYEVCNYFLWRSKKDCFRNFVSELCYYNFPKKSLEKLNTDERVKKLQNEKRIDINDYNIFLRNGTFIKREVESYTDDDKKIYWRNNYVKFALPLLKCNNDYLELLECKNFEEWEFQDIEFELSNEC